MERLLDLFAARVAETPNATALVYAGERLSFAQLDREANRVAQYVAGRGLGPEDLVGLRMDRGFEMAVGALGVLKSGAACLPLDPVYPSDLVAWMGEDAGVSLVLTNTTEITGDVQLGDAVAGQPGHAPDVELRPENLAYVMYTSGSSGKPKPVSVEHRHLAHVFAAWDELFRLRAEPLTFVTVIGIGVDLFFADLLRSVFAGGTMIIATREAVARPSELLAEFRRHGGDATELVPAQAKALGRAGELPVMRLMSVGSEGWPAADFRELAGRLRPGSVVLNAYGLTETTVDSLLLRPDVDVLGDTAIVPLGSPIPRVHAYVLDDRLRPVEPGGIGELYIGGAGVTRGYRDRPALTASLFVADPFVAGARMYRTGDVVRTRADGNLDYLGRSSDQMVELGTIEDALLREPGVVRAAAALRDDRVIGYVVGPADTGHLRSALAGRLPAHLVPHRVLVLDRMPLLPNGKLNRRALPAPEG
ncbi:amino acid adenylation domain-containing protein [Amycolatopsis pretoriensis]|uniref:Amino acid adenylation domain-containing protein n=1 Tax=Amycolatopsis pretoriensis TaxID=218821 RepID=A0A1H5QG36_9PSEU|nr:amino acid adenylation domain-containing protein [Amycolatopsis pretoriensis]SEF24187.1 amino acid adenylation domain-containing protein [Amycolatopsis pretoriensis]